MRSYEIQLKRHQLAADGPLFRMVQICACIVHACAKKVGG